MPQIRQVDNGIIQRNYLQIKGDIENLVAAEIERMMDDPELKCLIVKK